MSLEVLLQPEFTSNQNTVYYIDPYSVQIFRYYNYVVQCILYICIFLLTYHLFLRSKAKNEEQAKENKVIEKSTPTAESIPDTIEERNHSANEQNITRRNSNTSQKGAILSARAIPISTKKNLIQPKALRGIQFEKNGHHFFTNWSLILWSVYLFISTFVVDLNKEDEFLTKFMQRFHYTNLFLQSFIFVFYFAFLAKMVRVFIPNLTTFQYFVLDFMHVIPMVSLIIESFFWKYQ